MTTQLLGYADLLAPPRYVFRQEFMPMLGGDAEAALLLSLATHIQLNYGAEKCWPFPMERWCSWLMFHVEQVNRAMNVCSDLGLLKIVDEQYQVDAATLVERISLCMRAEESA